MTVRLYRSSDPGAPQLGSVGAIRSILEGCLVSGYGSRTPAGWSMPFEDAQNNKAVFKQGGVDGRYLWIDNSESYSWARVNGYLNMSDIDTGTEGIYSGIDTGYGYFPGCYYSTYNEWFLVANERFFYFYATRYQTQYGWCVFCGDLELIDQSNPYSFSMFSYVSSSAASSTTSTSYYPLIRRNAGSEKRIIRSLSQQQGSASIEQINAVSRGGQRSEYIGGNQNFKYPDIAIGGLLTQKILLADNVSGGVIGYLPSLLDPMNYYHSNSSSNVAYDRNVRTLVEEGGLFYYVVPSQSVPSCLVFVVDQVDA